jgi:hypothetical protein
MRAVVARDLADAKVEGLSTDRRFATAYNAALQTASIAIACAGYRVTAKTGHHRITVDAIKLALGAGGYADYLEGCRRKRNVIDYTRSHVATETEANEIVKNATEFYELVEAWIASKFPQPQALNDRPTTLVILVRCPSQRIVLQNSPRFPDFLLARLFCSHAFVPGRAVDRHLAPISASDDANELLRHITVRVNEPAAVPALPHAWAVYAVASDVRSGRSVNTESQKSSLSLHEGSAAKAESGLRPVAEKPRYRVNVQASDGDEPRPTVVVHPAVRAEAGVLLNFPPDVIEDVLAGQRAVVESGADLRPDLVPRTTDLLPQVSAQRSQEVRKLPRVPAVLMTARDRCARRAVIFGVVFVVPESAPPLLAWISVAASRPFGDHLGHVVSHTSSSATS